MPKNRYKYTSKDDAAAHKMLQDFVQETKGMKKKQNTYTDTQDVEDDEALDTELDNMDDMSIEVLGQKIMLAKLRNLEERTSSSREKSVAFRKQLFNNWSEKFTTAFEDAFSIFKNELINLHLNTEQIATLNTSVDKAIKKLEKSIQAICKNAKLNDEEEEEQQ